MLKTVCLLLLPLPSALLYLWLRLVISPGASGKPSQAQSEPYLTISTTSTCKPAPCVSFLCPLRSSGSSRVWHLGRQIFCQGNVNLTKNLSVMSGATESRDDERKAAPHQLGAALLAGRRQQVITYPLGCGTAG